MDNLKKVLTSRQELSGCLNKYTNVVKGGIWNFSSILDLSQIVFRLPATVLPSWRWKRDSELLPATGQQRRPGQRNSPRSNLIDGRSHQPQRRGLADLHHQPCQRRKHQTQGQRRPCTARMGRWSSSRRRTSVNARQVAVTTARVLGCIWLSRRLSQTAPRHRNVQRQASPADRRFPRRFKPQRPWLAAAQSPVFVHCIDSVRRLGAPAEVSRHAPHRNVLKLRICK